MQSFTTTDSQRNAQCLSECDSPICVQTSLGNLKPAVLRHLGTAVQKGLKEGFHRTIFITDSPRTNICHTANPW